MMALFSLALPAAGFDLQLWSAGLEYYANLIESMKSLRFLLSIRLSLSIDVVNIPSYERSVISLILSCSKSLNLSFFFFYGPESF